MKRGLIVVGAVVAAACGPAAPPPTNGLTIDATSLDFGSIVLGTTKTLTINVTNTAPGAVMFSVTVDPPFRIRAPGTIVGMGQGVASITFAPTAVGPAAATATIGSLSVAVTGVGVPPINCSTGLLPCTTAVYDPASQKCVVSAADEGATCMPTGECFSTGQCQGGFCVGTSSLLCSASDECHAAVCSFGSCANVETTTLCPAPTDPCHEPTCSPDAGCGIAALPDGVDCGPPACGSETVCIAGACTTRPVLKGQACVTAVVGQGALPSAFFGTGPLAPLSNINALAAAPDGSFWVTDGEGMLWRVTADGEATSVAGSREQGSLKDGFGASAVFVPRGVAVDGSGQVYLSDISTIRLVSQQGLVVTLVGNLAASTSIVDGIGTGAGLAFPTTITPALDGGVWINDNGFLRHVSTSGLVETLGQLDGLPVESMVAVDGGLLLGTPAGIVEVPDDTATFDFVVVTPIAASGDQIALAADGTLASTFQGDLRVHLPDGSLNVIYTVNDGGTDTLGPIASFAPGQWLVAVNGTALIVASEDGGARLLAGDYRSTLTTGPSDEVTVPGGFGLALISDGGMFFSTFNDDVFELANGLVSVVGPPNVQLLTSAGDQVIGFEVSQGCILIPYDGGVVPIPLSTRAFDGLGQDIAYFDGTHIMQGRVDGDGGYAAFCPGSPAEQDNINGLIHDGDGGFFMAALTKVTWLDSSCQYHVLGALDGGGGGLAPLTRDPSTGTVYVGDQHSSTLFSASPTQALTTIAQLNEPAFEMVWDGDGGLLYSTTTAIERLYP